MSVPYEGQLVYTLADHFHMDSYRLLTGSLFMQMVGLLAGGLFIRSMKASRTVLLFAIPFCMLCTAVFLFPVYELWVVSLFACSAASGACIASCGYFLRGSTVAGQRFRVVANIIVIISVMKLLINGLVLYVSANAGVILLTAVLGTAWYFSFHLHKFHEGEFPHPSYDRKRFAQALLLLCLFISISTIDFGIMILTIMPAYQHISWLSSWYWLLPYVGAALAMKRIPALVERNNMLFIALGMIGLGFILFLVLGQSLIGYLVVFTLMMGAWAMFDVFWWSMLGEMLDMHKNAAIVLGLGFCANAMGVLHGKQIAHATQPGFEATMISLGVICATVVLLPILHKSIAKLLPENRIALPESAPEEMQHLPASDGAELLSERERQIAALLLKGRTSKLIAAELFLSENTVKTHVKNIYSKLNVRSRAELFNRFDPMYKKRGEYI
ncbi:MAG: LuxR C-terminal-related transcriptional regulator [Bacillota bacterium]